MRHSIGVGGGGGGGEGSGEGTRVGTKKHHLYEKPITKILFSRVDHNLLLYNTEVSLVFRKFYKMFIHSFIHFHNWTMPD